MSELQFDVRGEAYTEDNPFYPGLGPYDMSFLLDTSRSTFLPVYGNSCLQSFEGTAWISNFQVTINGQTMMSAPTIIGSFGGDNPNGSCPGTFLGGLSVPNMMWTMDPRPGLDNQSLMASLDPISTLFLNFQQYTGGVAVFENLDVSVNSVTVTIPTPECLSLLLLGLVALAVSMKGRGIHGFVPHSSSRG